MGVQTGVVRAVGDDLAAVLPVRDKPWWRTGYLLRLNLMLFSAMLFSSTVGTLMMNGVIALGQWEDFMNHPQGAHLGGIIAVQAAGSIIAFPIMSLLANKYGRKIPVYIGILIITFGVGLQTGSKNAGMFIASRFFVGTASGFLGCVPILVTEVAFPTHRGTITALYNTLYYVGSLIAAWATFGTRNYSTSWAWRVPSLLQLLMPACSVTGLILAPESPRWLIAVGRNEEARAIFVKYHAGGGAPPHQNSALVEFEMAEVEQTVHLEEAAANQTSYMDMLRTKGNRHRLFISITLGIFTQWNGVGIVSYYLPIVLDTVGVTSVTDQTLINGFLQLWNLIIAVLAATQVDRLGQRPLLLVSSFGMLACYIIITGLAGSFAEHGNSGVGIAVIPFLFIYYGFYDIAYTPLIVSYPAEIWPYHLRSKGIAVSLCSTFVALFFNLFVNPIALANIAWKYYIVYCAILVLVCITVWFAYPETKGRSLEEMAVVFDGADAAVPEHGVILGAVEAKFHIDGDHVEHSKVEAGAKV